MRTFHRFVVVTTSMEALEMSLTEESNPAWISAVTSARCRWRSSRQYGTMKCEVARNKLPKSTSQSRVNWRTCSRLANTREYMSLDSFIASCIESSPSSNTKVLAWCRVDFVNLWRMLILFLYSNLFRFFASFNHIFLVSTTIVYCITHPGEYTIKHAT